MYVCICNEVTDKQIKEIIKNEPEVTVKSLQAFNVCTQCFKCAKSIKEMIDESGVSGYRRSIE